MYHLEDAKMYARQADSVDVDLKLAYAQLATAHATIALVELLAERLPLPAETASECAARLRKEEKDGA